MVAGLVQSEYGGIPMTIHVSKREGMPVRIDPNAPTVIAFRYVKPEDKYPFLTRDLAGRLGISMNKVAAFAKLFGLKGNDEYHTGIRVSSTGRVHRYSQKALEVMRNSIDQNGAEWLWRASRQGKTLDPQEYLHESMEQVAEPGRNGA